MWIGDEKYSDPGWKKFGFPDSARLVPTKVN
jgi:hypothetical protein